VRRRLARRYPEENAGFSLSVRRNEARLRHRVLPPVGSRRHRVEPGAARARPHRARPPGDRGDAELRRGRRRGGQWGAGGPLPVLAPPAARSGARAPERPRQSALPPALRPCPRVRGAADGGRSDPRAGEARAGGCVPRFAAAGEAGVPLAPGLRPHLPDHHLPPPPPSRARRLQRGQAPARMRAGFLPPVHSRQRASPVADPLLARPPLHGREAQAGTREAGGRGHRGEPEPPRHLRPRAPAAPRARPRRLQPAAVHERYGLHGDPDAGRLRPACGAPWCSMSANALRARAIPSSRRPPAW
jgi:hypothetical protein